MEQGEITITISEIMEYLFCPRFTYFLNCLNIPQYEEKRYKVMVGREIHNDKKVINKEYLRKKIGCIDKYIDVYLYSGKYHIRGIVDEVLKLQDGTYAPLDYKYAEYNDPVFRTHRFQTILYALMIKEMFNCEVNRGYIVFTRSKNFLKEVIIKENDYLAGIEIVNEVLKIIQKNYYPKKTSYNTKCIDCCYRNICV